MRIRLTDIYSESEINDDTEALFSHVPEGYEAMEFEVSEIGHDDLFRLNCLDGLTSVLDAYDDNAGPEQIRLVAEKAEDFDQTRVVVTSGKTLLDGYHHVAAAHIAGRGVLSIHIESPIPFLSPS